MLNHISWMVDIDIIIVERDLKTPKLFQNFYLQPVGASGHYAPKFLQIPFQEE